MPRTSEPITERQIAIAATRFISAKVNATDLKLARAKALTETPCAMVANEYPACFRSGVLSSDEWCDNCKANQPRHEAYRTAVAQKGAALRKLQSLVVRSLAQREAAYIVRRLIR